MEAGGLTVSPHLFGIHLQFGPVDQDGVDVSVVPSGGSKRGSHRPIFPAVKVKVGIGRRGVF